MKQLIKIGDREFIGDIIQIDLDEKLTKKIIEVAPVEDLENLMPTQIEYENYEVCAAIQKRLSKDIKK